MADGRFCITCMSEDAIIAQAYDRNKAAAVFETVQSGLILLG